MSKTNYLDLGGVEAPTRIGQSAFLRGTDGGECSVCHLPAASLVNGKCPKHADLTPSSPESKQPDLLGAVGRRKEKGGCWQRHGGK